MGPALTRDGRTWVPAYLETIDADACIGCGRCYRVCGRGVIDPAERVLAEDDDDESMVTTVMTVLDPGACVGCEACAKVCGKKAHAHVAA